ncbi:MAG: succinic semialdehyde dehydrogenase, partial [Acidimicrobiia bacterium]|nr:succinic semialdehyde dehydrogenase [Acidimicrobiia bacterium]
MTSTLPDELTPRVSCDLLRSLETRVNVPSDRESIAIIAPFTGQEIGSVPQATGEDVAAAADAARIAQRQWNRLSIKTRVRTFTRFHDLLVDRADEAIDLVQLEAGKSRVPAFEEVFDVAGVTRYYFNIAPSALRRKRRSVSIPIVSKAYEYRHPVGVVGFIVPWNFPFTLGISDAIPALLAGNGVVIKPDEKTPYSTLYSVALLEEAGLPEGLIQVVTGDGEAVGRPLIDSVDYVMFTGSTAVGRLVAEQAAQRLIGSSLELGGKNAALVLGDADLDSAVPGIARAFYANGGQLCLSAERIYVVESVKDEFIRRYVDYVRDLSLTMAYDFSSDLSSLIDPQHLANVHAHVEDAVEKGAEILIGGKPRPDVGPSFYEPTVLINVDETMDVCRTET